MAVKLSVSKTFGDFFFLNEGSQQVEETVKLVIVRNPWITRGNHSAVDPPLKQKNT